MFGGGHPTMRMWAEAILGWILTIIILWAIVQGLYYFFHLSGIANSVISLVIAMAIKIILSFKMLFSPNIRNDAKTAPDSHDLDQ